MTKELKTVLNTAKLAEKDPMVLLAEALVFGSSGSIERQEKQGQISLVDSDTIPKEFLHDREGLGRKALELAGVQFLGPVEGDSLFQYVKLPDGWKKVAVEHAMWSDLVDDRGRVRANMFYKAAFYDRRAHISVTTRFSIRSVWEARETEKCCVSEVVSGGNEVVFTSFHYPINDEKEYAVQRWADEDALVWLNMHYPDWKNAEAYWND